MVLSITLYEAFLIILLLFYSYLALKERKINLGNLGIPLILYAIPTVLSTMLYAFKDMGKAIERGIFPLLSYILGDRLKVDFYKANLLLAILGLLVLPVVLYKFYKTGIPSPIWGGVFEVGNLYILFAFASLSLFLYKKNYLYFIFFLIFLSIVFISFRRSAYLVLLTNLLFTFWLFRDRISKKLVSALLIITLLGGAFTTAYLVEKDYRFQVLYQVVKGEKPLDDQTLNAVSSHRWDLLKSGVEVINKDIKEGNFLALLIGHGIEPRKRLEPNPSLLPGIYQYESIFVVSEIIEKGILGTFGIVWIMLAYYLSLIKHKINDPLKLSFLLALNIQVAGGIFTFFWDAMLPLFLIMYRLGYEKDRRIY